MKIHETHISGIPLFTGILLSLIFTTLRIAEVITWRWYTICLPIFIGVDITAVMFILALLLSFRND